MLQYIALGVATYAAYKAYNFFQCPDELKHLYAAPLLSFVFFSLDMGCYREKMDRHYQPYLNKHGIIRVLTPFGWSLFVGDAKLCKEISTKSDLYLKPGADRIMSVNMRRFFGKSQVGSSNGEEWKKHRKIINPIFNQTWSTELFGTCAQDLIDEYEKMAGKDVKIHDKIQRMTLDVFGKSIFDVDFKSVKNPDSKLYNLYHKIFEQLFGQPVYLLFPFMEYMPFFRRTELSYQLDEYQEFIQEMIALRKDELKKGTLVDNRDLISALVKSNESSSEIKLTMEEIRANLNVFIVAGHDTTSNTLTSTLYYLARYPDIQEKLRAQILSALNNPSPSKVQIPTVEQLKNIPLMDLVNKESMRIMTTASAVQRKSATVSTLSNGLTIPAKTTIFLQLWAIHHNPKAFPDPFKFKPERFADNSSEESKNWQAFITGPRTCLGSTFSLMEQRVTLSMLLQKFEFCISEDNPNYHKLNVTSTGIVRPDDLSLEIKIRT